MLNKSCFYATSFGIFGCLLTALAQAEPPHWQQRLSERLPLLGHRNWVVIADSAYPLQSREGIETIATGDEQVAVLSHVLAALNSSKHVRPIIHLDAELPFVAEHRCAGHLSLSQLVDFAAEKSTDALAAARRDHQQVG